MDENYNYDVEKSIEHNIKYLEPFVEKAVESNILVAIENGTQMEKDEPLFKNTAPYIDELIKMVQFVGVQRPKYKAGTSYPVIWVDVPLMDISSRMIRRFIKKNRRPNYLLPKSVLDYIEEEGLYR